MKVTLLMRYYPDAGSEVISVHASELTNKDIERLAVEFYMDRFGFLSDKWALDQFWTQEYEVL